LRKSAVALALILVATLLAIVPGVAVAGEPKVVVIVGATEGTTDSYRRDADQISAAALQYTSNVVKVYSPNATWARVKSAVAGAAVVIYLGHGNGWPSPYTYDPKYTTKDGFGLNKVEGGGDSNRVYYGEPYIETLPLTGAVVILNHLCYASGNSESGAPEPSINVARQRVDNYASAFLRAGAAAVIADAHNGLDGYLRDLFTTSQPIDQLWANQADGQGNVVSFPSERTPGATAYQDPNTPTSGFYRSLVVRSAGAGVSLGSEAGPGTPPPASVPPQITQLSLGPQDTAAISPNGDGIADSLTLTAMTAAPGSIGVSVRDPFGATVRSWAIPVGDRPVSITWDGRDASGAAAPDGRYALSIVPIDSAGNVGAGLDRQVDVLGALGWVAVPKTPAFFAASGSALRPATLSFTLTRPMTVTWSVLDATNQVVATHLNGESLPAGTQTWSFDGRADDGTVLRPGVYTSVIRATDGSLTMTQSASFVADAFVLRPSTSAPKRGRTLTVTVTSAMALAANPRVSVYQPGLAAWSVGTVRLSATTFRATIRLKSGHTGTVTFKAKGLDPDGVLRQTSRSYHLS
jgi:hypothetical protein